MINKGFKDKESTSEIIEAQTENSISKVVGKKYIKRGIVYRQSSVKTL